MNIEQHIAENRFGLGTRPHKRTNGDVKAELRAQIMRHKRAPQISGIASSVSVMAAFGEYRTANRKLKSADENDAMNLRGMKRTQRRKIAAQFEKDVDFRLSAAIGSENSFTERLVHFWSNHFAISADKLVMRGLAGPYENEAIRPHITGRFSDLLGAVVQHPAMLIYLDQINSIGPNSALITRQKNRGRNQSRTRGLNENLAREILELHSLGVRSGYTQDDVIELAKALTGWRVACANGTRRKKEQNLTFGTAYFDDDLHEPGARTLLGKTYPSVMVQQSKDMLVDLSLHPKTAMHLATKLARHFVADEPPQDLITDLTSAYLSSGGNLSAMYEALIAHPACWRPEPQKFLSPWEWLIATMRALHIKKLPLTRSNTRLLSQLGQDIWQPKSPAGFDDKESRWLGPDAMMRRAQLADILGQRAQLPNGQGQILSQLQEIRPLGNNSLQILAGAESNMQSIALFLMTPEFLRR